VVAYDREVSASSARQDLARLARETGASPGKVEVELRKSESGVVHGKVYPLGSVTVASATLADLRIDDGESFDLLSPLRAFQRLGDFEVVFVTAGMPKFRGLSRYDKGGISVALSQGGGPYRYRFSVTPGSRLPDALPRYDVSEVVPPAAAPAALRKEDARWSGSFLPVALLAVATGTATLTLLLLRSRLIRGAPDAPEAFSARRRDRAVVLRVGPSAGPKGSLKP
jgi:hypothetical protein